MLGKVSAFSTAVATASVPPGQLIYGQLIEFDLSLYIILMLTFILSICVVRFVKWNVRNLNIDRLDYTEKLQTLKAVK